MQFIQEYPNSLPLELIDRMCARARSAEDRSQAQVSQGRVDHTVKLSWDSTLEGDAVLYREYREYLNRCYISYCTTTEFDRYNHPVQMQWPTILQHYPPGGGYLRWHCERSGKSTAGRALVFMTYLTTHSAGGTEFLWPSKTIAAERGKTVIWPADWQYTHRSEACDQEKIIATGWFEYC